MSTWIYNPGRNDRISLRDWVTPLLAILDEASTLSAYDVDRDIVVLMVASDTGSMLSLDPQEVAELATRGCGLVVDCHPPNVATP